jgi:signal transduction histidine kinase
VIAGVLAALAAAEWLRGGGDAAAWAWVAGVAGLAAVALGARRPYRPLAVVAALSSLALGVVLVKGAVQVGRIQCCWPAFREARVTVASRALQSTLAAAMQQARRLAERGATAALLPREAAFAALARATAAGPRGIERGVVIIEPNGTLFAWAGRHRAVPAPDTAPELRAVITPFYAVLEARRQTPAGVAVGTVLLSAAPAMPDQDRTVGAVFERAHGVGLQFYSPGYGPRDERVFDICPAGCEHGDTLLSVLTISPAQGDAKLAALAGTSRLAGIVLALTLALLLAAAAPGVGRWGVALAGGWALLRASPLVPGIDPPGLFSPATFYRPVAGVAGASAGTLMVAGILVLIAASGLWRRGVRRRPWNRAAALFLVLAAPYLVRYFGRGIAPPAGGVSMALWLSWQGALAVTAMALILLAAALVRGPTEPSRVPWSLPAACAWAGVAAVSGLWLWSPYGAWPEWYTFLWLPALGGVILPAPRRWALPGIAVVAGTAAALITWGAAVEGRLQLAERDARRLGREGDELAVALLERLGQQVLARAEPHTAGDLYTLWVGSPLVTEDYPAVLQLWDASGRAIAELPLATLELPPAVPAAFAASRPTAGGGPRIETVEWVPGVHYVLVVPFASGEVLTVVVGPRSRLLPPDRTARFLRGDPGVEPPYAISLSLPDPSSANSAGARLTWRRVGWAARGERRVDLPEGVRHVHVRVDLRGPWALLVRGSLVVLLDVALLAGVWLFALVVAEGWRPRAPTLLATLRTSYRARLTAALVAFFVLPVLGFAAWSFARLADEARRSGDLLIRQTLRDAVASAGAIAGDRPEGIPQSVVLLGRGLNAELWLYRRGRLVGTSSPVLTELGLVDPFLAPPAFLLTLEDELELTTDARTAGRPTRVGYRVVGAGASGEQAILAAPQLVDDERVRRQQEDLALALVLATLAGLVAAVYLAGLAAGGLAKPVAALRDAALAVGRGSEPAAFPPGAPREFEPVLSAFARMATDVRRSQAAIEEARQRTARVLANVATGVIAVDDALRVTMANARAAELLGDALAPGDELPLAAPAWGAVWQAVNAFMAAKGDAIEEKEFEIAGRQIRVQLAPLGPAPDGCVIALDDATALTRAARVLAWGEMARQVAHEIKNPLTPIRLGIQHLQRVKRGGGAGGAASFETTLQETADRILVEIDRLDGIARAFSRFGAPAAEQPPLETVDLAAAAREVVQLYGLGSGQRGGKGEARFEVQTADGAAGALARKDEVKEVLVNLLENARDAGAKRVVVHVRDGGRTLSVADDGRGIAAEILPRVFEPTFSTTSSGSGLGLAIARRLVESWGGTIGLESEPGRGTTVTLTLQGSDAAHTPR